MTTYCFYHKVDLDGQASAAIVKKFVPDVVLMPFNYNEQFPWEDIKHDDTVYFVDLALQPYSDMVKLCDHVDEKLYVFDHHKTFLESEAYRTLKERIPDNIHCDTYVAGCELTWEALSLRSIPLPIRLLGQYDSWRDTKEKQCHGDYDWDKEVMPFQFGMRLDEFDFDKFIDVLDDQSFVQRTIVTGRTILKYQDNQNAFGMKSSFEAKIKDYTCLCLNGGLRNSQVFKTKWDPKRHDFMVCFSMNKHKQWSWSFYSTREDRDAGSLAKQFNGGGHKGAAGCVTEELIFERR